MGSKLVLERIRIRVPCNQRYSADVLQDGVRYAAFTPGGAEILGTYDMLPARAEISYFTTGDEHGVAFEFAGNTEIFWDGAETQTGTGERVIYLCRDGAEWFVDQLWFEPIE